MVWHEMRSTAAHCDCWRHDTRRSADDSTTALLGKHSRLPLCLAHLNQKLNQGKCAAKNAAWEEEEKNSCADFSHWFPLILFPSQRQDVHAMDRARSAHPAL